MVADAVREEDAAQRVREAEEAQVAAEAQVKQAEARAAAAEAAKIELSLKLADALSQEESADDFSAVPTPILPRYPPSPSKLILDFISLSMGQTIPSFLTQAFFSFHVCSLSAPFLCHSGKGAVQMQMLNLRNMQPRSVWQVTVFLYESPLLNGDCPRAHASTSPARLHCFLVCTA